MNNISIKIFPRIHINLLDMSSKGYRMNGGIGFFINKPYLIVNIELNSILQIEDQRSLVQHKDFPQDALKKWLKQHSLEHHLKRNFKVSIHGKAPSHTGFGVSTAIRMACIEGIYLLQKKQISENQVIHLSCRGGTSGIGVHGYFSGGLVFDLGHKQNKEELLPSRNQENNSHLPLLLKSVPMPNWDVGILIPHHIPIKTNAEEKAFFKKTCPILKEQVYESVYHSLFGILASVETKNKSNFCKAIKAIQTQTWKQAERNLYPELTFIEEQLYEFGADAVGMSSLGPMLFFFSSNIDDVVDKVKNSELKESCSVFKADVRNQGREIIHA